MNRASFIGETLESILGQLATDCEVVVLDAASTDGTESVVSEYTRRCDRLRYFRQNTNNGIDRDFDHVVELARGDYCWLMSDDDLLKPGALRTVLNALSYDYSLVLVNGEHRDLDMSSILVPDFFDLGGDRTYSPSEMDRLFADIGKCLICICCVVVKRSVWLARDRERYYGTMFIHVGVIFQEVLPGPTLVIAEPLMSLRWGNHKTWLPQVFEIFYIKWPSLVWSLAISDSAKRSHCLPEPWRRLKYLLPLRAVGTYQRCVYHDSIYPYLRSFRQRLIPAVVVMLPSKLVGRLCQLYFLIFGGPSALHEILRNISMLPKSLHKIVLPAPSVGSPKASKHS